MGKNQIVYGSRTFAHGEIKHISCYLTTSLTSLSLESNTLKFDVESNDETLVHFRQNDPLVYSHNGRQVGTFYVQSVKRIGPTQYRFFATSLIGILSQKLHAGGIYTGQTVHELVSDICGEIPFSVKKTFRKIKLYGWLPYRKPPDTSARDNLAQVLFAIGAAIRTDLNGVLRIEGLWDGTSGSIGKDSIYNGPGVEYGSPVSAVSVLEHQYALGTEENVLFEGTAQSGTIIIFDEPAHTLTATGFSILDSGANWAKLSDGTGTLAGKRYVHNTRQITKVVNEQATENIKAVENATLVSLVNSVAVAERLANYYACTQTIKANIVLGSQRPGDIVSTYHPYDRKAISACVRSLDIKASSVLAARAEELVAFAPLTNEIQVTFDEKELLTGSGEFVVPDGVHMIRGVLIDPGTGGNPGSDGEDGGRSALIVTTAEQMKGGSWSSPPGKSGKGGAGGSGGIGGRIYQFTIDVTPGDKFPYFAPVGTSTPPEEHTTFGELSALSGSQSDTGYTDPITGDTYATSGENGKDGGAGGDGGNAALNVADDGIPGADVPPWTGGANGAGYHYEGYLISNRYPYKIRRGGGGGGGAARGGNGGASENGANRPGHGAPAEPPQKETVFGRGGRGGNGGGGGGGAGGYFFTNPSTNGESVSGVWYQTAGGSKGAGSPGGEAGDGCIILYMRKTKTYPPLRLQDKTGHFVLDRTGRMVIV